MRRALLSLGVLLSLAFAAPAQADFGFQSLSGGAFDAASDPLNTAGAHPHRFETDISFNTAPLDIDRPVEDLRDVVVALPPGFIGNPTVVPPCPAATFIRTIGDIGAGCPPETQIGVSTAVVLSTEAQGGLVETVAIYNLTPGFGRAARFGFTIQGIPTLIEALLSPIPPYRPIARVLNVTQYAPIYSARTQFWGIPAAAANDTDRCVRPDSPGCDTPSPDAANPKAFLSLPTRCDEPLRTEIDLRSWKGSTDQGFFDSEDIFGDPTPLSGCGQLGFVPALIARPTTNVADAPSGLEVEISVPQETACVAGPPAVCAPATAHLKDVTVELPEGLAVNPASANGLAACSPAQIDLAGPDPAACPDAAKIADVEVDTPLLDHPVPGAVYLATPHDNPFNSLLAIYVALHDPQSATVVKLAGEVRADPLTGQLSSTFEGNPQVPFSGFSLDFKSGPHAPLRTPSTCGDYTTDSQMTPWSAPGSGPPATPSDTWTIAQGPNGACAGSSSELPNAPSFDAGSLSPIAGRHAPFVLHLRRDDGSQNFSAITLNPPPGLVAKLAGTPACPEEALKAAESKSGAEEKANPSCPVTSEVGNVVAGAGAGPAPYYASAKAYLSGPYKGAPLSFAVITPVTAGPFDLGTIVTRIAIYVNSKTAEITAVADPIPAILEGIPLDVRSIDVSLDKPNFALNGTSCDPMAVGGLLTSTLGQIASLSSRFQLAECTRLPFKPKMVLRLKGSTKRAGNPALTAVLAPRAGDANIASVSVALPPSEFLDNAHIGTVCTRVQFAADQCPSNSIYGEATVTTPILDYPLAGNVYLRSSENPLPDLVPDLRGPSYQPIKLEASGRTDSIHGGLRNSFEFVPDAPFSRLLVELPGGRKGLIENSRDICAKTYRATVRYTAHNGLTYVDHPKLGAGCPKRGHKKHRKGKRGGARISGSLTALR
jgi:hypothetical protein